MQVKSASGKTMLVERSKLERVMGGKRPVATRESLLPLENEASPPKRPNTSPLKRSNTSPLKRPNTRASRALENCGKDANKATIKLIDNTAGQHLEITLEEEAESEGKVKVDLKRKVAAEEGEEMVSRRLRRRG